MQFRLRDRAEHILHREARRALGGPEELLVVAEASEGGPELELVARVAGAGKLVVIECGAVPFHILDLRSTRRERARG